MYIRAVLSNLNAKELVTGAFADQFHDIQQAITEMVPRTLQDPELLQAEFFESLVGRGWKHSVRLERRELDFAKDGVGAELRLGSQAQTERFLLLSAPLFIRVGLIRLPVVVVPMRDLTPKLGFGVNCYENLRESLLELCPLPVRHPFLVLGFSPEPGSVETVELSTPLDAFCIQSTGYSLEELCIARERPNYDFKEQLPDNSSLAQQVCGFANLRGGGLLLLGITDSGELRGIERARLDETQLRITNVIRDACQPTPGFELAPFDLPETSDRAILVVRVEELAEKPCMTQNRVYLRVGPSVRPATSAEIRRMLLA